MKRVLSFLASTLLLSTVLVSFSGSSASAATDPVNYTAPYAASYRIYLSCSGQAASDGINCLQEFAGNNLSIRWGFYAHDLSGGTAVAYPNYDSSMAWNGDASSGGTGKAIADFIKGYPVPDPVTAKAGTSYVDVYAPPGKVLARPVFSCTPAECYAKIYISIVPMGNIYNSSGQLTGTNPGGAPLASGGTDDDTVPNPGIPSYGSDTNNTIPAPGGAGGTGSGLCTFYTGASDCTNYGEITSMADCVNINPIDFKFDIPCMWTYLFVPSDKSVSSVNSAWDSILNSRQPFVWFKQLGTTAAQVLGSAGICTPLSTDIGFNIWNFETYHLDLFPCDGRIRDMIRPYSTWAIWLLIASAIGSWAWRKVEPSLNAQGGA